MMSILDISRIVVGVFLLTASCVGLEIPESFSSTHKSTVLQDLEEIPPGLLRDFQLDTHVHVILLGDHGDLFTGSNAGVGTNGKKNMHRNADLLAQSLEHLSALSVDGSRMNFTHEKLVYHVNTAGALSDQVAKALISESPVDSSHIEGILLRHYRRETFTTALYVLNFQGIADDRPYSYISQNPGCQQKAFISRGVEGLAWVDLQAGSDTVEPAISSRGYLAPPSSLVAKDPFQLASFVHRSTEALIPSPRVGPGDSSLQESVHLTLITVCNTGAGKGASYGMSGDGGASRGCTPDVDGEATISSLVETYHSSFRRVTSTKVSIDAASDLSLHLAVQAATRRDAAGSALLSPRTLAQWLPSSPEVRQALMQGADSTSAAMHSGIVIVIFQQAIGVGDDGVDGDDTIPRGFSEADESVSAFAAETLRLDTPTTALSDDTNAVVGLVEHRVDVFPSLFVVKPSMEAGAGAGAHAASRHPDAALMCDRRPLMPSATYLSRQLRSKVLHLLWRDCEDSTYYSTSARQLVTDYFWSTVLDSYSAFASSEDADMNADGQVSFVGRRCLPRHTITAQSEHLMHRLNILLTSIADMRPRVHAHTVLSDSVRGARIRVASGGAKRTETQQRTDLLQRFLSQMDQAATEFSHVEYGIALQHLQNAEVTMATMEDKVSDVERSRSGRVLCVGDEEYPGPRGGPKHDFDPDAVGGSHHHPDHDFDEGAGTGPAEPQAESTRVSMVWIGVSLLLGACWGVLSTRAQATRRVKSRLF